MTDTLIGNFSVKAPYLVLANLFVMVLVWLNQVIGWKYGMTKYTAEWHLTIVFTAILLIILLLSLRVWRHFFKSFQKMYTDLNVVFLLYAMLLLIIPSALGKENLSQHSAGMGILFS
ncbi:hypothetical protein [Levilactobacillus cerevisiae]|uniref:hypothetical protein n=1 Tax=Levilactobacillus cerevisiae TaxID=1704076 RepID=UPI000F76845B|nr:hypothetical protein [Levilactobacillus cerevisiae]